MRSACMVVQKPRTIISRILFSIAAFICFQNSYGQLGSGVIFHGDTALRSDDKTLFTGEYVDFAPDARIRGQYKNGLKEGVFKYYSANAYAGRARGVDSMVSFHLGRRDGLKEMYYESPGRLYTRSVEYFKNDVLNGECSYWHASGQLEAITIYAMGRKVKETKYPVDNQLRKIDYLVEGFSKDTVYLNSIRIGDTVKFHIVGYKGTNELVSLKDKGFKIKSFVFRDPDFEMPGKSQYLHEQMVKRIVSKGHYYWSDRFFISGFTIVDPNGQEYMMPDKTFYIR